MTGPIPSPNNFEKKLDKELDSVKDRHIRLPGYQYPIKRDEFISLKNGNSIIVNGGKDTSLILNTFGCKKCKWVNSDLCPHKGDVTHLKPHANGICSQRLDIPLRLHEEGIKMTTSQMLEVRGYMDADFYETYIRNEASEKKRDMMDCLAWAKLKADIVSKWRKQDEGSKIKVTNEKLDPLKFAKLLRDTREERVIEKQDVSVNNVIEEQDDVCGEDE